MEPTSSFFIAQAIWGGFVNIAAVLSGEVAGSRTDQGLDYLHGQLKDRIDQFKPEANHDLDHAVYRAYLQACAQVLLKRHKELGYDSAAFIKAELLPAWSAEAVRRMRSIPNLGKSSETERQWIEAALTKFSNLLTLSQQPDFLKKITVHKELVEARDRYALLFRPPQGEKQIADLRTPLVQSVIDDLAQVHPNLPEGVTALVKAEWFDLFCGCFQTLFKADDKVQAIVLGKLLAGLTVQAENGQMVKVELDEKKVSEMLIKSLSETLRDVVGELLNQQTDTLTAVTLASENRTATRIERVATGVERLAQAVTSNRFVPAVALPADWSAYHQERINQWSADDFQLQRRFVRLTLQLLREDNEGNKTFAPDQEDKTYQGLDELLAARPEFPVLVVLGDPGCGKSTLLRHLQLLHSQARLADGEAEITLLLELNRYKGEGGQTPRLWLAEQWKNKFGKLPPLDEVLREQRVLFLLDALNEMKPAARLDEMFTDWRDEVQSLVELKHRVVLTCRERDYRLPFDDVAGAYQAPLVLTKLLEPAQVREFVEAYAPEHADAIWAELAANDDLLEFYRTPFFLDLLCQVIRESGGAFPQGRASLFTKYVGLALLREYKRSPAFFTERGLLHQSDQDLLTRWRYRSARDFTLPDSGLLIPALSQLATSMHQQGGETSLAETEAKRYVTDDAHAADILAAGISLNVLHRSDDRQYKFYHHQLQEYFAARQFARAPDWSLVTPNWSAEQFAAEFAALPKGAALPALKQSHWVETTVIAAPMAKNPNTFISELLAVNQVLAARCALSADLVLQPELKADIQTRLRDMLLDQTIDVRARIAAGEQLGWLGDTRFTRCLGAHGDYLLPPFALIPAGSYLIGLNDSDFERERNATRVKQDAFRIGAFPVTNAEYALFMRAGGYQEKSWWNTPAALHWLEYGGAEEEKKNCRQDRQMWQSKWTEETIYASVPERWNQEDANWYVTLRNWSPTEFEEWLREKFADATYNEPAYWNDSRFNNPSQPVVGVTWYEARAYCNWLTATVNDGRIFRLPTEAQFEAAARGKQERVYPYGNKFDVTKSNTYESGIRRTTPVGIFDNATPEGAYDLTGNGWNWTLSLYRPYPYNPEDGRENLTSPGMRAFRGSSWHYIETTARAVSRNHSVPGDRGYYTGFRLIEIPFPFPGDREEL